MVKYVVNNKFVNLLKKCYNSLTIVFLIVFRIPLPFFADRIWIRFLISFFKPKKKIQTVV